MSEVTIDPAVFYVRVSPTGAVTSMGRVARSALDALRAASPNLVHEITETQHLMWRGRRNLVWRDGDILEQVAVAGVLADDTRHPQTAIYYVRVRQDGIVSAMGRTTLKDFRHLRARYSDLIEVSEADHAIAAANKKVIWRDGGIHPTEEVQEQVERRRRAALARIAHAAERARADVGPVLPGQVLEYLLLTAEARHYLESGVGERSERSLLAAGAATGERQAEVARRVLAKAEQWQRDLAAIRRIRLLAQRQVATATTVREIEGIVGALDWSHDAAEG